MNVPAKQDEQPTPATIEDVLIRGDLSGLTPKQRVEYASRVCKSIGVNPLTQPFKFLVLSGKLTLYATRDCADQLRKINGISIKILGQEKADGLLTVHAHATDKTGRTDEDFGVVPFKEGGASEIAANLTMKAVTKAKRRVTLSISGLGFLDENEVADPNAELDEPSGSVSTQQLNELIAEADGLGVDKREFIKFLALRWKTPVRSMADIPAEYFDDAMDQLDRKRKQIERGDAQGEALL